VVRFDPSSPAVGPFPTDFLTVADPAQKTGRRINLPLPDCATQPSSCQELGFLNQLDGFGLQPRIRVRFSGPVNPDTLRAGIGFVWLDNLTNDEFGLQPPGHVTPINQVIYDPDTNTAYAKPDEFFDQHRRYALVVTDAVKDLAGDPVKPDPAFQNCVALGSNEYCRALAQVIVDRPNIVSASVFTTMSVTDFLEKARAGLQDTNPGVQPAGSKSVFNIDDIAAVTVRYQKTVDPSRLSDSSIPSFVLAGIGRIAFGSFQSPSFLNDRYIIPATPTATAIAAPLTTSQIYFHAFLPKTAKPAGGYPVVIVGHGFSDDSFGVSSATAATFARAGFASIAINMFGHGYGPGSKVSITDNTGTTTDIPTGGRGVPLSAGGNYGSFDGCVLPGLFGARDCLRQTVVDLMQLVRAIGTGIDLDGDTSVDLDRNLIYYVGHSFGGTYGTILTAVEPNILAAALNSAGGTLTDITRTSQSFHALGILILGGRTPSLLNKGGDFDDGSVLRYRPVRVEDVPGAIAIQEFLDLTEWYGTSGDAVSYAPHLASSTLPGVPIKPVLFQYGGGDTVVPNPAETNLVRAANMREKTRYLRYDLARAAVPQLPASPHSAIAEINSPAELTLAAAIQQQIAGFLASSGSAVPDVNDMVRPLFGKDLFEAPAFLTEDFNFIR
jgi:pimeloyl-ACP methyl ester carboxylesterase